MLLNKQSILITLGRFYVQTSPSFSLAFTHNESRRQSVLSTELIHSLELTGKDQLNHFQFGQNYANSQHLPKYKINVNCFACSTVLVGNDAV